MLKTVVKILSTLCHRSRKINGVVTLDNFLLHSILRCNSWVVLLTIITFNGAKIQFMIDTGTGFKKDY